jgi:Outer membrane protein and related peptidoglycan-associated (lipo)proteins
MHLFLTVNIIVFSCFICSAQKKDTVITLYFNKNEFNVSTTQKEQIAALATKVLSIEKVTGYADTIGSVTYNKELSKKRAYSVAALIPQADHPPIIDFKGEEFEQDADLSKNRRVEVLATLKQASTPLKSLSIENIYFVPDRAIITDESLPYVKELADMLLKNYKTETFEIVGHVNYETDKDSSQLQDLYYLSERRARTIYLLLKEYGIPVERMHYKGVGNSQPVIPHPKTDEEKRKNMRVEVIISK